MYQSLARLYNQIKLRLKFCDTFGEQCVNSEEDAGKVRHHKSIRDAGAKLQDESLSIGRRLEAAYELGVLSYTGDYLESSGESSMGSKVEKSANRRGDFREMNIKLNIEFSSC